ncbi:nucleotidyltransferase family protein [Bradyrhizobium sp. STM 3557]|uniref:nucleotidyltransferase family protein n=1 Tax=Bradyrhizobium sp. STM 3557 TaxID=578920 RepID=UPI00389066C8
MNADEFLALALRNPINEAIARELAALALPDAWLVAGCLTQTVWNALSGRPLTYGIHDYDIFYFDPDTSWEAEDAVIKRVQAQLASCEARVEIRNQARVHLWYPAKHGKPYAPLTCAADGIDRFLTVNTQAGVRPTGNGFDVYAPKGFDDIADMIVRPNPSPNFSAANYSAKAARWKALWPEIRVMAAEEQLSGRVT